MTTLPAIRQGHVANMSPASPSKKQSKHGIGNQSPTASARAQRRQSRFLTLHDRELLKHDKIRSSQPIMDKISTAKYRNSYFHNLCVGMLKDGYHRSFDELFSLTEKRKKEREAAGPDSILWEETPLIVQYDKLDRLFLFLTKAEAALRSGKHEEVYNCRHNLAQYFLQEDDIWLSDHFFNSALSVSLNIKLDGRRREGEANCHMALAFERRGDIREATKHMLKFHEITLGRTWQDDEGINLHHLACRHLCRLYTTLAEHENVLEESRKNLHLAYDQSKEGEDMLQQAQTAQKLGCAYEAAHQSETAIQYLEQSLSLAKDLNDDVLIGQACEALAKSHQSQGAITRSIEFLELYALTSRNNDLKEELVDASNCLGEIYNHLGRYGKAIDKFSDAYSVSQEIAELVHSQEGTSSLPTVQSCAIQLGIASGNNLLNDFEGNMEIRESVMMDRIAAWKDDRENEFGSPLPTPVVPTPASEADSIPDPTQPFTEGERVRSQNSQN